MSKSKKSTPASLVRVEIPADDLARANKLHTETIACALWERKPEAK